MAQIGRSALHDVMVQLLRFKCLPILIYGTEACNPTNKVVKSLDYVNARSFFKYSHAKTQKPIQTVNLPLVSTKCLKLLPHAE